MAEFTLERPNVFPDGTEVGAYAASDWPTPIPPTGEPTGTAADTGTVASNKVTFTGLSEGTAYWAVGKVGETYRYISFLVPTPPVEVVTTETLEASGMGVVLNGTKSTARPTGYKIVTWIQEEEPENKVKGDIWIEA